MDKYGSDKPDLRFELPLVDLTEVVTRHDGGGVGLLQSAVKTPGGIVKGWRLPAAHAKALSRADLDKLEEFAKGFGARGLARARIGEGGAWAQSPMKTMTEDLRRAINDAAGLGDGDLLFLQFGGKKLVNAVLGGLRLHVADKLGLIPRSKGKDGWRFCWITDFPLFEHTEEGKLVAAHHPFTSPQRGGHRTPRERPRLGARARLQSRAERQRDRRRVDPDPSLRPAGARLPGAGPQRRGRAREVRLPAGGLQVRSPAPRRDRGRRRSPGDAPVRRRFAARRDRVPEDAEGHRPDDGGARARSRSGSSTSCTSPSRNDRRGRAAGRDAGTPRVAHVRSASSSAAARAARRRRATRRCAGWTSRCATRATSRARPPASRRS